MQGLPLRHAVALGLLHGPTELLPISSSGHTTLVPWLAGWPYGELDPQSRKSFEVALHAGTAAALLLRPPSGTRQSRPLSDGSPGPSQDLRSGLRFLLPAVIPPALAGYALGGQIERRLGTPASIVAGLLGGSIAMLAADRRGHACAPSRLPDGRVDTDGHPAGPRAAAEAGPADGLALGLAQALALMPGVSRSGATLAAARARGFTRRDADRLSWRAGLPVIAGAVLLKGTRHIQGKEHEAAAPGLRPRLVIGCASAFLSTLASARVLSAERRAALLPAWAAYRGALALLAIRRMRDNTRGTPPFPKK
jgi:undecaprenyl-diphosphatase